MNCDIFKNFKPELLVDVLKLYSISKEKHNAEKLSSEENLVYQIETEDKEYILRLTHSSRRSLNQVKAEIYWVNYLYEKGATVSKAIISTKGNLVEICELDDFYFSIVLFEKAKGRHITHDDWNSNLFKKWGEAIGQIHALTKDYKPINKDIRRYQWYEYEYYQNAKKYIPSDEKIVLRKMDELFSRLHSLPKGRHSYGLIHADAHELNLFINNRGITIFDFDECEYRWFASDIATVLYYSYFHGGGLAAQLDTIGNRENFATTFMDSFLQGYNNNNNLDKYWLSKMPDFLKLQEFRLYIALHKVYDVNNLNELNQKMKKIYKYNIENDVPYVNLNFQLFSKTR